MSTLLDAEPVVLEEIAEALVCYIVGCAADAEWEWLMNCSCAFHYCGDHDAQMRKGGPGARVGFYVVVSYRCPDHGTTQLAMRTPL